nr:MAG TPA: hypothetical protein [Caudoviricetes sp.]
MVYYTNSKWNYIICNKGMKNEMQKMPQADSG